MTRWQSYYHNEPELALVDHSLSVVHSSALFEKHGCRRILDVACGTGREARYLQSRFPLVAALDFSPAGLLLAREKGTHNLFHSDAGHIPFQDKSFDGIYCYGLLHEFCGPEAPIKVKQVMAEIKRTLKDDGLLILAALEGDPINGDPDLPEVQLFSDIMFFDAANDFHPLEYKAYNDISCTGNPCYHIHYGAFVKSRHFFSKS